MAGRVRSPFLHLFRMRQAAALDQSGQRVGAASIGSVRVSRSPGGLRMAPALSPRREATDIHSPPLRRKQGDLANALAGGGDGQIVVLLTQQRDRDGDLSTAEPAPSRYDYNQRIPVF